MEGDDFVNTAVSLKEKNENTVGRNTAIKERFDELNKINDTWMNSLNNCWKPCTWYSLLRGYDDSQLKSICGSDGALYIVYLRYSAYFFTLMSMGNGVLIYIYVTGDNKNLPNVMQSFTISAISGEVDEEYLVFVYAIIGITCLSVLFIISYMVNSLMIQTSWLFRVHLRTMRLSLRILFCLIFRFNSELFKSKD